MPDMNETIHPYQNDSFDNEEEDAAMPAIEEQGGAQAAGGGGDGGGVIINRDHFAYNNDELLYEDEPIVQFSDFNIFAPRTRRYMDANLGTQHGANLTFLYLSLNNHESRRNPNHNPNIETEIVSDNPLVLDSKLTYPYRLYRIPQLTTFAINYILNVKSWKMFFYYLKNTLDLAALMPFLTPLHALYSERRTQQWRNQLTIQNREDAEGTFRFCTLWRSGIDVEIAINKLKLLVIHHSTGFLMMNRLKKSIVNEILLGLRLPGPGTFVKTVHLDNVEVEDLRVIPTDNLERLLLHKVKINNGTIMDFVGQCDKLRLLYCKNMNGEEVDFNTDLHFGSPVGPSLTAIVLGNARLTCSEIPLTPIEGSHVNALELHECQCDESFFLSIPNLFPRLKVLKFTGIMTLRMLNKFLTIGSINILFIWQLEMVPNLVARSDPSIREVKLEEVQVVQTVINNENRQDQILVNVVKETVLKTFERTDLAGKISWSYDLTGEKAAEEPEVSKATKKFLMNILYEKENEKEKDENKYVDEDFIEPKNKYADVDFSEPICEAFLLRKTPKAIEDITLAKRLFEYKESVPEPCGSKDLAKYLYLSDDQKYEWEAIPIGNRHITFPTILCSELGCLYPYASGGMYLDFEGIVTRYRDTELVDQEVKNTLEHFDEIYLLD